MNEDNISHSLFNKICDQFEDAWQLDSVPSLNEYVENLDAPVDQLLLEQLIEIDIELRLKRVGTVKPELYSELGESAFNHATEILAKHLKSLQTSETRLHREQNKSRSGSRIIGPYKLLQKLGEGGMGEVWMAEQETPVRRRVALKIIKSGMADKQIVARFEAERQALAMMEHQNIAKVLDAGTDTDGSPYLVMELVQGIPITQYSDINKLTPRQRLELFIPVCRAIQHAHQKGIIHRDLKPANVLVSICDRTPVPKVIDFGLAKSLQHQVKLTDKTMFTEYGQVIGTVQYMSPEQAVLDALDVDTRSDIYSLGVMLYELLAGSTPIDRDTLDKQALLQVLKIVREKDPPRPSHRLSTSGESLNSICDSRQIQPAKLQQILQGDLDWVVMKALEKDRTRRYESANEFANDINRFLNDETVIARPQSLKYRATKFASKNRGLVATAASVFALLLAGIAGTSFGLLRANSAKEDAVEQREIADRKTEEASSEKERADKERDRATSEAAKALAEATRSRNLLAGQYTANGVAGLKRQDTAGSLPWFAAAMELSNDAVDDFPRRRLEIAIGQVPKVDGIFVHDSRINDVEMSHDGLLVATASVDGITCVWEVATGNKIATFEGPTQSYRVRFHKQGRLLVTTDKDAARVWDIKNQTCVETKRMKAPIVSADFDGNDRLFVCDRDGNVEVKKLGADEALFSKSSSAKGMQPAAYSTDLALAVTCNEDSVQVWSVDSDKLLKTLRRSAGSPIQLAFDSTSKWFAAVSDTGVVQVWDAVTFKIASKVKHVGCNQIVFDKGGERLATITGDDWFSKSSLKVWSIPDGAALSTELQQETFITSACFHPNGKEIITTGVDDSVFIRSLATRKPPTRLHHLGHVMMAKISDDQTSLWTAGGLRERGHAQLWSLKEHTLNTTKDFRLAKRQQNEVTVVPNPETRLSTISVINSQSQEEIAKWKTKMMAFKSVLQKGEKELIVMGASPVAEVYQIGMNELRLKLEHPSPTRMIRDADFDDHGVVVTGAAEWTGEGFAQAWDLKTGQPIGSPLRCGGYVSSVSISLNGKLVAAGSRDHTATIWHTRTGEIAVPPIHHESSVSLVKLSKDGTILATACDSDVYLWDVKTHQMIAKFIHQNTVHEIQLDLEKRIISVEGEESHSDWEIGSLKESREGLLQKADLYSGRTLNQDGHLESLSPDKLQRLWLQSKSD